MLRGCLGPLEEPPELAETGFASAPSDSAGEGAFDLRERSFGDYELIEEIGRGGMGVVYRARQRSLHRTVALKMVLPSRLASPKDVQRFKLEAEAAAQLDHPHILPIYEVGEHQGQPYYTMKLVESGSLATWMRQRGIGGAKADPARRGAVDQPIVAALVAKLARAVAYAHAGGVLHRDLKPANILVDARGEPYVADFGLAKFLARDTGLTLSSAMLGTPAYAAPEQVRDGAARLTTAADIYSLGAILYELLTGRPPFQGDTALETYREVLEEEVQRPRQLDARIDRDLETIALKCLEKDPARRYASATQLADDLDRYLRQEPIAARPVSAPEQLWRWCRRKPALAGSMAALVVVLALGFVGVFTQWRRADANAQAQLRENYYSSIALAHQYIEQGSIDRALETLWKCPEQYRHWEWGHLLYLCHQDAASFQAHETNIAAVIFSPDNRWVVSRDTLGVAKIWDWQTGKQVFGFGSSSNRAGSMTLHQGGAQLAAAMGTNGVSVWATTNWQLLFTLSPRGGEVTALAYGPEGQRLVTGGSDGMVTVWDTSSGQEVRRLETTNQPINRVAISPDGKRLVAVAERAAWVWELDNGKRLRVFPDDSLTTFVPTQPSTNAPALSRTVATNTFASVFADDTGEHFATIDPQGRLTLWPAGRPPQYLITIRGSQPTEVRRVFFSPDSRRVLNAGEDNTARLWETGSGEERLAINERVQQALFTADGSKMVVLGTESWGTLWDLRHARKLKVLRGHERMVTAVALSRDGRFAATGDEGGTVKVWSASLGRELAEEETWLWGAACSPDGRWIVSGPFAQGWVLRSSQSGRAVLRVHAANESVFSVAFSPDSRRIVTAGSHKNAKVWDLESGRLLLTLRGHWRQVYRVAYSRDGRFLATGSCDGTAKVWDAQSGVELRTFYMDPRQAYALTGYSHLVLSVEFDTASSRLITASTDGMARVWDFRTGRLLTEVHAGPSPYAKLHPSGSQFATYAQDGKVRLWNLSSGELVKQWTTRGGMENIGLNLCLDGRRLIVPSSRADNYGADSGTIEVWDVEGAPRETLTLQNKESFTSLAFSPDGRRLVAGSLDFNLHQWESFPWKMGEYAEERSQESEVRSQKPEVGGQRSEQSIEQRVRVYAQRYWRERLKAQEEGRESGQDGLRVIDLPVDRASLPKRDAKATRRQIDLGIYYTGELTEPFHPYLTASRNDIDLSALPRGLATLGAVLFDVRGVIQLGRTEPKGGPFEVVWKAYPVRADGIPVQQEVHRLHLLLGTAYTESVGIAYTETDGTVVGSVVLHYADGTQASLDLVYGRDVRCWNLDPRVGESQGTDRGKVVWTGTNPVVDEYGGSLRLYLDTRENPRPGIKVTTVDFVSAMSGSAPFLIAITVE